MDNQVPLWAFLIAATAGPAIGAGIAVLGTWLTIRHTSRENRANRALERMRIAADLRKEQANTIATERLQSYSDAILVLTAMEETAGVPGKDDREVRMQELVAQANAIRARIQMLSSAEGYKYFLAAVTTWRKTASTALEFGTGSADHRAVYVGSREANKRFVGYVQTSLGIDLTGDRV